MAVKPRPVRSVSRVTASGSRVCLGDQLRVPFGTYGNAGSPPPVVHSAASGRTRLYNEWYIRGRRQPGLPPPPPLYLQVSVTDPSHVSICLRRWPTVTCESHLSSRHDLVELAPLTGAKPAAGAHNADPGRDLSVLAQRMPAYRHAGSPASYASESYV